VAVISLATFPNNAGLVRVGGNNWTASNNSGAETANIAGTNGLGTLTPGAVEMSNVNLAQEFTNMITAERGFQANSRVISTADEMLQELVNLKH
jgi:flagellar hook protein FlgE